MTGPASRRGFLRGLTTLPLIGGSVALIGQPSRAATPITPGMLATYSTWLHYERRSLHWSSLATPDSEFVPFINPAAQYHFLRDDPGLEQWGLDAQLRAPVILAAAGCPLTSPEAEEAWSRTFRPGWNREGGR